MQKLKPVLSKGTFAYEDYKDYLITYYKNVTQHYTHNRVQVYSKTNGSTLRYGIKAFPSKTAAYKYIDKLIKKGE
jgi:hypothetical protein